MLDRFDPALGDQRRVNVPVPLIEVLRREIDDGFRRLMDATVAEERGEVIRAEARARVWLWWIDWISKAAALGAVAIGVGSDLFLRRRLDRPLRELAVATDRVAAGDLGHRVVISGDDEISRPGGSFNHMTEQIAAGRATTDAARADLEEAVRVRTAELAEANAAILGEADVTLRARDGREEDYRTTLTLISEQAALSAALVDDLLFMARADGTAPRLRMQRVSLPDVVRRSAADVAVFARERGVRIDLRVDDPIETIQGDPGRLLQLATILLDNAIGYSRPCGIVEVLTASGPAGVVLQVIDHGMGIPEDEAARIFERFFRGSAGGEAHQGGSGLGLAMAGEIVKAHGGTITLDSLPDDGSVFGVAFPSARRLQAVK